MAVFIFILMFCVTIYAADLVAKKSYKAYLGVSPTNSCLTTAGCIAISIITLAFDTAGVLLLMYVV